MSQKTMWERFTTGGKTGFDKVWKAADKLGAPVNRLSNKLGSEAFWPTSLDKESDKAARILKSFCKDGFYAEEEFQPQEGPKQKQRVLKKIPEKVIQNAKGLCIFTTMRTGLWVSGSGGSGVIVARLPDGSWSPPSGILMHTAGVGFLLGVDIYDCVIVINTEKALEAFQKLRCTLGSEVSVAAGPVGAGGFIDTELHKRQSPVFTYLKSRGFYAGVAIEGTIIIERVDENERFYGQRLGVQEILAGKARHPPYEVKRLMETLKAAQGDRNVDESMIPTEAPPGDYEIDDGHTFGVPDQDDPDPYGVLALEKEGMSLKEAATKKRASWEEFTFHPSASSPVHNYISHRRSLSRRSSWRTSGLATEPKSPSSIRESMEMNRPAHVPADASTQTDLGETASGPQRRSMHGSHASTHYVSPHMEDVPENSVLETSPERKDSTIASQATGYTTPPRTPPADATVPKPKPQLPPRNIASDNDHKEEAAREHSKDKEDTEDEDEDEDEDDDGEEAEIMQPIQTVRTAQSVHAVPPPLSPGGGIGGSSSSIGIGNGNGSSTSVSKPRLVNVPKRVPPKLPARNPNRGLAPSPGLEDRSPLESSAATTPSVAAATSASVEPAPEALAHKLEAVRLSADAAAQTEPRPASVEPASETAREKMPGGFD